MARGSVAKTNVENKLAIAFGKDFIGNIDRKLYVWADDGGERVQIAISMTCPKTFVDVVDPSPTEKVADFDFEATFDKPGPTREKAVITEEEKTNIINLMERLGL